jgi:hypothetical protein
MSTTAPTAVSPWPHAVASADLGALLRIRDLRSSALSLSLRSSNGFEVVGTLRSSNGGEQGGVRGEHCGAAVAVGKEKEERDETGHCTRVGDLGYASVGGVLRKISRVFLQNGYAIKFCLLRIEIKFT